MLPMAMESEGGPGLAPGSGRIGARSSADGKGEQDDGRSPGWAASAGSESGSPPARDEEPMLPRASDGSARARAGAGPADEVCQRALVTSKKELWGWYLYEASSSGYSGSVLPVFLPLLVLTLVTSRAWEELGSHTPPACDSTIKIDCTKCVPGKGDQLFNASGLHDLPHLRIHVGGLPLNPVSFTTIAIGVSILFQLVVFISYGPFTDYGNWRRAVWLWATAFGAAGCVACFGLFSPYTWWLSGVLLIFTNVCYGIAYICYNSYLPSLTDTLPEVKESKHLPLEKQVEIRVQAENRISLAGINVGNPLGAVCILLSFTVALVPGIGDNLVLRLTCVIGGVWWALLSIPSFLWVRNRPGPPLPAAAGLFFGWRKVWTLLRGSRKYKYAFRYLLIYFVYSDGYTTLNQVGVLFAQQELCMSTPKLVGLVVLVGFFAFVGNPVYALVQNRMKWSNNTMVMLGLLLMGTLPGYAILGYFSGDTWGLKTSLEMFIFAAWYGTSFGALSSYSRTLYVDLIPVQQEAAMFTLFALSSKGSSWLGPLIVALLYQVFGNLRTAFVYALIVIIISILLLYLYIDNVEGMRDAGRVTDTFIQQDEEMAERVNHRAAQ